MEKINFVNGQAPYLNDENLNQIQDNAESAIDNLDPSKIEMEATEISDNDLLLLSQSGINKKVKANLFGTGGTSNTTVVYDRVPIRCCHGICKRKYPSKLAFV